MEVSEAANPGRERILARIAGALKTHAPREAPSVGPAFAAVGNDLLGRFQSECQKNLTECVVSAGDVREKLRAIFSGLPAGEIFVEDTEEFRALMDGVDREVRWSSEGLARESAQATVTRCEALVAQTGSVMVSSACGGRRAFVVAPVHVVVAKERQLVADLEAAMALADEQKLAVKNSYLLMITGCSRTGDIEKLLVIGAHGPKRLIVMVESGE